ncbi:MAG: endopeptidase La [Saprospiraceae bacterium]|nr:endopeptidase La [Saprospiraceae bacterium]
MFEQVFDTQDMSEENEYMPLLSVEIEDDGDQVKEDFPAKLPLLVLKNTVHLPNIVIPITVGRDKSIKAVQKAYDKHKWIAVLTQIDPEVEDPTKDDLYKVGTIAKVMKIIKMPDGNLTAILQGKERFDLIDFLSEEPFISISWSPRGLTNNADKMEYEALISSVKDVARQMIDLSPNIPKEAGFFLKTINSDNFLINFVTSNLNTGIAEKQRILEIDDQFEKAKELLTLMHKELQYLVIRDNIDSKTRVDIDKQQRDYFLNQQLKTIQEELGGNPVEEEIKKLLEKADKKKWQPKMLEHFEREVSKLRRLNPMVGEYSVMLNYLEFMVDLPYLEVSKDNFNIKNADKVLNSDHFGLKKVKERILEHLSVLKLKNDLKAPILCLVGPPGVGKTSLGKSIAKALNREFIRMSLGGLHDESEIRGHRKTYIGAMPGRILQSIKKCGKANPVFLLDEIDKLGKDHRGDPSSALLEVLDPEQNATFYDNYLEMEYDLSKVLFIATANSLASIQPALLDRLEIIDISGYSTEEKVEIAKRHLIPEQAVKHGLDKKALNIKHENLEFLIKNYTRESGVRSLDRQIAGLMRNLAKRVANAEVLPKVWVDQTIREVIGLEKYSNEMYTDRQGPGVAIGLAWTSVGGEILFIEVSKHAGKGKLLITGNLGDVMKESATTALTFLKANAVKIGIDPKIFEETDIHIHVPEGAIPKDGPSAGITMLTALASCFTDKPVKPFLAMTGEITLRGKVLPVGGIKEKILAAKRAGLKNILLCNQNKKHVGEIEAEYIAGLEFIYVDQMREVLQSALGIWDF